MKAEWERVLLSKVSLEPYKDALFQIRRNGFTYSTGYEFVTALLNITLKDVVLIKKLQTEFGHDWWKH